MTLKNIIFDLGHVIIDIEPMRTYQTLSRKLGLNYDMFETPTESIFYKFETGVISEDTFLETLRQHSISGVDTSESLLEDWNAMLIDIPLKRLELLVSLSANYRVFILSNTNESHINWVEEFLYDHYGQKKWAHWGVEKALYSHDLNTRKPESLCFKQCIAQCDIRPEATLFIDDNLENVEAARKCGLKAEVHPPSDEICAEIKKYLSLYSPPSRAV